MSTEITLEVNGQDHSLNVPADTPLLYVLRNDLDLKGPRYGCGEEQCGACKVLVDGQAVPSCRLPVGQVVGRRIMTVEGLSASGELHPLQEAFVQEQAIQCGFCTSGMIIGAQALLNRTRTPSDDDIREALADHLCRCGVYDRVRRAIKLQSGQPERSPTYEVQTPPPVADASGERELPRSLAQTSSLDRWVRINEDDTVTFFTGKVEYGQGLSTALAQIGAEELDVSLNRVGVMMADTAQTPDEGLTVASRSLETSGRALRWAAAAARHHLLSLAFEELEAGCAGPEELVVSDGTVKDPVSGRSTTYWRLMGGRRFGVQVRGTVLPKEPTAHTVVGRPATRLDLCPKVSGAPVFVQDVDLPGMIHGRVVRPPRATARLVSVESDVVAQMPGVLKVVRDGSFLAVVAEREEQAVQAAERLRESAEWQGPSLPPLPQAYEQLFGQPAQSFPVIQGATTEEPVPSVAPPTDAAHTLSATYRRPYQMHASLGPSAAVGLLDNGQLTLWVHTQGVFPQQANIAHVLGMAADDIRVIYRDGAGCYGHNGADDAALDAALLARAMPGRPVSLKWSRADEHGWEPYGPAMQIALQASLNASGEVVDWNHEVWSPSHSGRSRMGEGVSGLLASWYLAEPFSPPPVQPALGEHIGSHRNADPLYAFRRRRIVKHHLPQNPLRVSSMRGLGAYANVFAIESFMDELAERAGVDPVAFRLRHLSDERARAVIRAAAEKAGWQPGQQRLGAGRGRGIAFARYKNRQTYAAIVVDVQVDVESGEIRLERAVIAADAGLVINPDGLSNQLEGGFVQAASLTLYEQVLWDEAGVVSRDWDSYPILRFPAAPVVETVLLNRPDQPHLGAGEAAQGPTPAAIANAVFAATGIRLREIPFTAERVSELSEL